MRWKDILVNIFNETLHTDVIVYKKTDEWYIEWQRVTTNDIEWYNKWQRVVQRVTTNDSKWQRVTTSDKKWQRVIQRVTASDNKWQWVWASDSSGTTNENGTVDFKDWVIAILSRAKTDTLLLQRINGCN